MTTPGRIASQAGDLIRQFNHETITTGDDWQYPPHAYDAIGSLAYMIRMLPQAIEQAMRPVQRTHDDGRRVTVDGGGDPAVAVAELRAAIADATTLAQALSTAVDRMHSAASPLGLDTRGLPEFEEREPCGESGCICYGTGPEHADCACGCDCPRDADGQLISGG